MSQTITENLALLRQHVRALEERAEAAEGKLDIIKRRLEGEPDDSLAIDYGGTGWGKRPCSAGRGSAATGECYGRADVLHPST